MADQEEPYNYQSLEEMVPPNLGLQASNDLLADRNQPEEGQNEELDSNASTAVAGADARERMAGARGGRAVGGPAAQPNPDQAAEVIALRAEVARLRQREDRVMLGGRAALEIVVRERDAARAARDAAQTALEAQQNLVQQAQAEFQRLQADVERLEAAAQLYAIRENPVVFGASGQNEGNEGEEEGVGGGGGEPSNKRQRTR